MELQCSNLRVFNEPIRLALSIFFMEPFKEILDEEKLILKAFEQKPLVGFEAIFVFLNELWLKKNTISSEHFPYMEFLAFLFDNYNKIAGFHLKEDYEINFPNEMLACMKVNKYLCGDNLSPLDILTYELLDLVSIINAQNRSNQVVFEYIERVKINPAVEAATTKEIHYMRPISKHIPNQISAIKTAYTENINTILSLAAYHRVFFEIKNRKTMIFDRMSLRPRKILKKDLNVLLSLQQPWARLMHKMSKNLDWIEKAGSLLFENDPFWKRALEIAKKARDSPFNCNTYICSYRNDFMYESIINKWKQIEMNTNCVGNCIETKTLAEFQKCVNGLLFSEEENYFAFNYGKKKAEVIAKAHNLYKCPEASVLIILANDEDEIVNDISLQVNLQRLFQIKTMKFKIKELDNLIELNKFNGAISINKKEISVVVYMGGFLPKYYDEMGLKTREIIEVSKAIKSSPIILDLVGTKTIQAQLSKDENLSLFLDEDCEVKKHFKGCLGEFWEIDSEEKKKEILDLISKKPQDYVLKRNGNGGGLCFFNEEIINVIENSNLEDLKSLVLMKKYYMSTEIGYILDEDKIEVFPCVSELGIHGIFLADKEEMLVNEVCGFMAKTKKWTSKEGGLFKEGSYDTFVPI